MVREVQVLTWCDLCLELDEEYTPATEMPPVTIGAKKPRVLALCQGHQEDFFDKFAEVLESAGTPLDQLEDPRTRTRSSARRPGKGVDVMTTSTGKRVMCPVEDCTARPLKNLATLSSHLRGAHSLSMFEAFGKDGHALDEDGTPVDMPEIRETPSEPAIKEAACDQPGCDVVYAWPEYKMPVQAVAVHKAKSHGIKGSARKGRSAA